MAIPDPRTKAFAPAPPGFVRVVAWRQRTSGSSDPEHEVLHRERAALLHRWATDSDLTVGDWGETDGERPREFVEMLLSVSQAALAAGLGALMSGSVKAYFDRKSAKAGKPAAPRGAPAPDQVGEGMAAPTPLFAVTIVNQSGGTIVVMYSPAKQESRRLSMQVLDPGWTGSETIL